MVKIKKALQIEILTDNVGKFLFFVLMSCIVIVSGIRPLFAQGWVDDGTVVRLETSTDKVGIGTTTPQGKLSISQSNFPLSESMRFDWGGGSSEYHSILTQFDANAITGNIMRFNLNNGPSAGYQSTALELLGNGDINVGGSAIFKGPYPWVDVRAYGAKGDGATDDASAIQSAINAAATSGGNVVFIPAGNYALGASLNIGGKDGITFMGASKYRTYLQAKDILNAPLVTFGGIATGRVTLRDFHIAGNKSQATSSNIHGINITNATDLTIFNIEITDCKGSGIYSTSNTSLGQWVNVKIVGCDGDGLHLEQGYVGLFTNINIGGCGGHGISWNGGESYLTNIVADQNGKTGIFLNGGQAWQISNVWAGSNKWEGIHLYELAHSTISGVSVWDNLVNRDPVNTTEAQVRLTNPQKLILEGFNIYGVSTTYASGQGVYLSTINDPNTYSFMLSNFTIDVPSHATYLGTGATGLLTNGIVKFGGNFFGNGNTSYPTWNVRGYDPSLTRMMSAATTWAPPSLGNGAVASTTVTVTGAAVGDIAYASHNQIGANDVQISAHVQGTDTVRVVLRNVSGSTLNIASGTLRVNAWKY